MSEHEAHDHDPRPLTEDILRSSAPTWSLMALMFGGVVTIVVQTVVITTYITGIATTADKANSVIANRVDLLTVKVDADEKSVAARFEANTNQRDSLVRNRDMQYDNLRGQIENLAKRQDATEAAVSDINHKLDRLLAYAEQRAKDNNRQ